MELAVFNIKHHRLLPNIGLIIGFILAASVLWVLREPAKIELYVVNIGLILLLLNIFWKSRERIIVTEQGLDIYQIPRQTKVDWREVAYINYTDDGQEPRPYLVLHQANELLTEKLINQLSNANYAYRVIYLDHWEKYEQLIEVINQQLKQQSPQHVQVQFNIDL